MRQNLIRRHFVFLEFAAVGRKPQPRLGRKRPNTAADLTRQCLGNQTVVTNFYCLGIVYTLSH